MASLKADSSAESDSSSLHEEDPSTQPEAERSQWRGGYDCQFVGEILPEEGECPICDLIYSDPYQMRCCGKRICGGCVEKIKAKSQPCPYCKEVDVSPYPDKAHMQSLGSYKVNCPNRSKHNSSEGCEWEGWLSDLDRHLNLEPTIEKQLEGCPFTRIKCGFCFELFERRFIDTHQSRECPKRPYDCEYCEYSATFEEVTQQHSNECPSAPVTCPNNCELVVFRSDLDRHRNHDCPKEIEQCEFHAVGCQVELPRRDMSEHKKQNVAEHSVALSRTLQRAMADITFLQGDIITLQGDINSLQGDITTLQGDSTSLRGDITTLQGDIITLQGDSTSLQGDITSLQGDIITLQGDSTSLQGDIITLQGDSTSLQGDITTLQGDITTLQGDITTLQGDIITLQGDGTSLRGDITTLQGDITTLQEDIITLQGDSTSNRGDITTLQGDITTLQGDITSLQSKKADVTSLQGAVADITTLQGDITTLQEDITTLQGDITSNRGDITTLQSKIQPHITQKTSAMQESIDKIQERVITQNERIKCLCVVVVLLASVAVVSIALLAVVVTEQSDIKHSHELDVNMLQVQQNAILKHLQMLPHKDILPFEFEMKEFEKYRESGQLWHSPSFYINGYIMCIGVEARGKDGKYVSVTAFLMAGVADDDLKWPFREDIKIELINQASSSRWNLLSYFRPKKVSHVDTFKFRTMSVLKSNQRVTTGEMAPAGVQIAYFISLDKLEYNSKEETQYLKDGKLKFRVSASSSSY